MTIENKIIGEWGLESFEIQTISEPQKFIRKNAKGILIYTPSGYMSVSINSYPNTPITNAEENFKSILFYAGTYEINNNIIIHHVTNASDYNRIGKDMIREIHFKKNKLFLIAKNSTETAILSWKKIT